MALSKREQRLAFVGLTERDEALLRTLRPVIEQHEESLAEACCQQLEAHSETSEILRSRAGRQRLKGIFAQYLLRFTEGKFDDNYFADRQRLGHMHERIGLLPRWYLLGYGELFRRLAPLVRQHCADAADETLIALQKIFMLDASLAVDAYIASDRYRRLHELESIINDSADAIFTVDTEKRFRSWNRAAEEVFGWKAEEITGKPVQFLMPPDLLASGELEQIDNEIAVNGHIHLETVRLAKDGRRVPIELSVSVVRDPQDDPIGRCAILRDITERKRLEDAKLQAERLAVIGSMSAKLAHEIRNPLSSVILNLDLVGDEAAALAEQEPSATAEMRTLLNAIRSEVRRIQRVTEDYLQFARMPKPRRDLVSLNELLTQGLSFLQTSFDAAGVIVTRELDPSLPAVHGDEAQLWQAILNLIRNALEAMPHGGTLTLATVRHPDSVLLRVSDTGKGLDPVARQNLFKPFFSTKPSGTGLGLPLTQQVITEHGGRIRCESDPGRGTSFLIELPGAPDHATQS
jgi:PAS domain S-box-containing protein